MPDLKVVAQFLRNLLGESSKASREALTLPTPPNDRYDVANSVTEKENAAFFMERDRVKREQIRVSLDRIKEGTYGTCLACGDPISEARLDLKAVPWTPFCVRCQERLDCQDLPGFEHLAAPVLVARRTYAH